MATASSQGLSGTARLPSMTHRVRTFHGCLTCRRRKVKCDSQQSPCKTCNRLGISCTPSFPSNFKNSSLDVHPIRKGTRATQPVSDKNPPVAGNQGALQTEAGPNGSLTQQSNEVNPWISDHIPSILSYGVDDIAYDLGFQPFHMGDTPSFITADVQFQPQSFNNGSLYTTVDESSLAISSSATPATDIRCANLFPNHMDAVSPDTQHSLSPIPRISDSRRVSHWDASSQAPQAQIRDTVLIRHYESTLSTFFSVKLPQWNLYTYMLRSQEKSNSPLWNSIMAWTSLHLARRDMNPTRKSAMYYDNASDAVQRLLKELSIEAQSPALVSKSTSSAEQLYMVLSTTFFLSHCNVMICDRHAFSERLDALKLVLRRNWETVHGKLGSLASRLLIWLAYLDLRASLWGDPGSTDQTANHNPGLLDMLDDFNALPSLRSVSENQSYLSECFGDNYPSTELREDLVQEPVNATSDDIMCILSRIKAFEAWNDEMIKRGAYEEDADVRELRATRAQALRDEIACIRAELNLAFPVHLNTRTNIDRTSFHYLTVSALHLSATILLNRILEPNVRTDEESQSAALGICKITHQLRRAGCLRTPRSLVWPLPIFIAGIETTDVIYQDWILDYMAEMEDWGPNMKSMRSLLGNIIKRQERENRRVKVRHVMEDFGLGMIL